MASDRADHSERCAVPPHGLHAIDHSHLRFVRNKPAHLAVQHDVIAERTLAAAEYALRGQMALGVEELKDQGVGLHMIDLGGDVIGNGISKMVFTILAAVAEGERDRLRERIRDAKRHLSSQGVFSGGKRPFGYDIVLDGEVNRLVPNEAEMAVIDRMQAMRRHGATLRVIGAVTGHGPSSVRRILERVSR